MGGKAAATNATDESENTSNFVVTESENDNRWAETIIRSIHQPYSPLLAGLLVKGSPTRERL
jgi:hypothetical protein